MSSADAAARMLDRTDPVAAIAETAERCRNWGRWGPNDVHGTLNFPSPTTSGPPPGG